jgi:hypothetical protein
MISAPRVCRGAGGARFVASLPFAEGLGVPPKSDNSLESPFVKGGFQGVRGQRVEDYLDIQPQLVHHVAK